MTEDAWLGRNVPKLMLSDSEGMLRFLAGKASARKLRLFACGWARSSWSVPHAGRQFAVETAERYADGRATRQELLEAYDAINGGVSFPAGASAAAANVSPEYDEREAAVRAAIAALALPQQSNEREASDRRCNLLRDIFGNPFRPVTLDPAWLTWNDGCAVAIARRIYDERRFDELPILGDALEEAGCTSGDILSHCRQGGEHVRGCWVVDLVLGKA